MVPRRNVKRAIQKQFMHVFRITPKKNKKYLLKWQGGYQGAKIIPIACNNCYSRLKEQASVSHFFGKCFLRSKEEM